MAPIAPPEGRIREASQRDRDAVAALWTDLALHHVSIDPVYSLRPNASEEILALVTSQLRDPDAATFVWERTAQGPERGSLAGLCIVRIDRAPPINWEVERAEVTDLIVAVDSRRRGIGGALLDAALAWVARNEVERVEVRVATRNPEGQAFWRARGFADWIDVLQLHL
jgi:GNAT superfamily N-acetyltransferase